MNITQMTRRLNRLRQVAHYIDQNLASPLRLEDLADIALISPFHFERVFKGYAGETPLARVRRLRLAQARAMLEQGRASSLIDLAFDCGYASAQAFSRAFRSVYGVAPSQVSLHVPSKARPKAPATFQICQLSAQRIQYIPFCGQGKDFLLPFDELRAFALSHDIARERRKAFSIHLDGKLHYDQGDVQLQAAFLSDQLGERLTGLDQGVLPAGHYAVFPIQGGYQAPALEALSEQIEQHCAWRVDQGPILRKFQNSAYLPSEAEKRYDLYIPVKKRG